MMKGPNQYIFKLKLKLNMQPPCRAQLARHTSGKSWPARLRETWDDLLAAALRTIRVLGVRPAPWRMILLTLSWVCKTTSSRGVFVTSLKTWTCWRPFHTSQSRWWPLMSLCCILKNAVNQSHKYQICVSQCSLTRNRTLTRMTRALVRTRAQAHLIPAFISTFNPHHQFFHLYLLYFIYWLG